MPCGAKRTAPAARAVIADNSATDRADEDDKRGKNDIGTARTFKSR